HKQVEDLPVVECWQACRISPHLRSGEASQAINQQEKVRDVAVDKPRLVESHHARRGRSATTPAQTTLSRRQGRILDQMRKLILEPWLRDNGLVIPQGCCDGIECLGERLSTGLVFEEVSSGVEVEAASEVACKATDVANFEHVLAGEFRLKE